MFKPLVLLISFIAKPLLLRSSKSFGNIIKHLTTEEIKTMVDMGHETGVLEQYETEIIKSALSIDDLSVSSIITPRVDIECVSVDDTIEDTIDLMLKQEYSRLPVYEDSIDNIVGIVHIKDLFKITRKEPNSLSKSVTGFMREAFHVPESKTISELLKEMQVKRIQMAIVSDEYGGTAGLVTMEDILEQIVGDIRDEHDSDEMPMIHTLDDNSLLIDVMVSVSELNKALGVNLPNNQTVGRLIFESLGEVPNQNQIIDIENVSFIIKEIDGIRVQKVIAKKIKNSDTKRLSESEISKISN